MPELKRGPGSNISHLWEENSSALFSQKLTAEMCDIAHIVQCIICGQRPNLLTICNTFFSIMPISYHNSLKIFLVGLENLRPLYLWPVTTENKIMVMTLDDNIFYPRPWSKTKTHFLRWDVAPSPNPNLSISQFLNWRFLWNTQCQSNSSQQYIE